MISQKIQQVLSVSLCTILLVQGVAAQTSPQSSSTSAAPAVAPLTADQLDTLVAPIALYPDALVAQVLAAAGFPDQVAFADDWLGQNSNLQGAALTEQVNQQPWDPSVKALTQFPSVLHDLAKNLSWTSNLGQAFTNQQSDVMTAVQVMRAKAQAAGSLKSSSQIKVVQAGSQTIVIEPADANVVYVPQYNPAVVYGTPLFVPAYNPPVVVAAGLSFGAGVAIGAAFGGGGFVGGGFGGGVGWGFGAWGCNWGGGGGGGNINYNHNTYITNNTYNRNSNNNNGNRNNNNGNRNNNNGNRNNNNGNRNNTFANNGNNTNRSGQPDGGRNGNHGLIGGNGGVQHQPSDINRPNANRSNAFAGDRPRSAMSGNGDQARAEANRGRSSMHPAAFQRQGQQRGGQQRFGQQRGGQQRGGQQRAGGERGGGRR
jgi:Protein of unknown function (DUF3300)